MSVSVNVSVFYLPSPLREKSKSAKYISQDETNKVKVRDAIHQLLNIILQLRILVLLLVSTLPYVVKVNNYS
jgi:hypothetical protein